MKYSGFFVLVCILLITAGCLTDSQNSSGTPAGSAPQVTTTTPERVPGQDPLVGVWRISNSQGYDDRFRFSADGKFVESFYDVPSAVTQIHSGTWSVQEANSYLISDAVTGKSRTLAYDPVKRSIHFTAIPHLIFTPYTGDIAPGVAVTTINPTTITSVTTTGASSPGLAIPSPLTFRGIGSKIIYFDTKAPGNVKFRIYYNLSEGEDLKCSEEVTRFQLAGKSVDTTLYYGKVYHLHDAVHTFNLLTPGQYSIMVKGCWGWNMLIDNA